MRPITGLVVRGVVYKSTAAAAKAVPCHSTQLSDYKRMHNCTMQEAIDHFVADRDSKTFDGQAWRSAKEYIESSGLPYDIIKRYRLGRQCTWQEAIDHYISGENSRLTDRVGNVYTVCEFLSKFDISQYYFYGYANKHNMTGAELVSACLEDIELLDRLRKVAKVPRSCEKLSKRKTNGVVDYVVRCKTCGRTLRLDREMYRDFVHSEEFCTSHEYKAKSIERYTLDGESGLGLVAACKKAHCSISTLRSWSERTGKTLQESLTEIYNARDLDRGPWEVCGQTFQTRKECAAALGVTEAAFYNAAKSKGSVQAAIDHYSKGDRTLYFNGNPVTAKEFCGIVGVPQGTISTLTKKYGWTRQETLDRIASCFIKVKNEFIQTAAKYNLPENRYIHTGPTRWSVGLYCKSNGLDEQAIFRRIYSGKSADQALVEAYPEVLNRNTLGFPVVESVLMRRDGVPLYLITCEVCGCKLLLTRDEYLQYKHSDAFCAKHGLR